MSFFIRHSKNKILFAYKIHRFLIKSDIVISFCSLSSRLLTFTVQLFSSCSPTINKYGIFIISQFLIFLLKESLLKSTSILNHLFFSSSSTFLA